MTNEQLLDILVKQENYLEYCISQFYGRKWSSFAEEEMDYISRVLILSIKVGSNIELLRSLLY